MQSSEHGVLISAAENPEQPRVLVTMGSDSDLPLMRKTIETLRDEFGITCLVQINSVHRDLRTMIQHIDNLPESVKVIIACAGGAAHLPGNIADLRADLPVIGVPRDLGALKGIDALLSMVQMPEGAPVAVMAIGEAGAVNAAIHAAKELAIADPAIKARLLTYAAKRKERVLKQNEGLEDKMSKADIKKVEVAMQTQFEYDELLDESPEVKERFAWGKTECIVEGKILSLRATILRMLRLRFPGLVALAERVLNSLRDVARLEQLVDTLLLAPDEQSVLNMLNAPAG
jgi:phosphoribosylaminoimidazole carboxylase PurE protein